MTRIRAFPSFFQVTVSVLLALVATWTIGFFVFFGIVTSQKQENPNGVADLAVVLTGGTGRVEAGFELLADERAEALLISGVHKDVTLSDLIELWNTSEDRKNKIARHCCIVLGRSADDTKNNAAETYAYVEDKEIKTIRIVTSNYHIPRAWILFSRALPGITLSVWPVAGNGPLTAVFWRNVFVEYSKTLLTWMS
ncbi:MAG: YdcF family protein [Proteobacteria bacterium]|nr:YdcF family protein [Pseudomonadota bacterium]